MRNTSAAIVTTAFLLAAACSIRPGEPPVAGAGRDRNALVGTAWVLQALGGDVEAGSAGVFVRFGSDGKITGNDGCNSFSGAYTVSETGLALGGDLAATMMACPDPVETRARAFREALQRATIFTLGFDGLALQDDAGRLLVRLVPAMDSLVGATWEVTGYTDGALGIVGVLAFSASD